jgi:enamine deaminase RidA (YjgF/YER057c/UK114 family)
MVGPEARLHELAIRLPQAPQPFGAYVEAVQTGGLLFLTGMMPIENQKPKYVGRIGKELSDKDGKDAARIAALNALAVAQKHLGSLDKITRVVRVGVYMATSGDTVNHPQVADGASELFREIFGVEKMSARLVIGAASLPLGVPIELEVIFEVKA